MTSSVKESSLESGGSVDSLLQRTVSRMGDQKLHDLCISLFPIESERTPEQRLDHALKFFFEAKRPPTRSGEECYPEIKSMVQAKAEQQGPAIKEAVTDLLSDPLYREYLLGLTTKVAAIYEPKDVIEIVDEPSEGRNRSKSVRSQPQVHPREAKSTRSDSRKHKSNHRDGNYVEQVSNLWERGLCLCRQEVGPGSDTLLCLKCERSYHRGCMKRDERSGHCAYCHLSLCFPDKAVRKTLFIGRLSKRSRKQKFSFSLDEKDLSFVSSKGFRLQVRSFRLTDKTRNIVLFPDSFEMRLNGSLVKKLQPLHRQSSIKFRRDEPFQLQFRDLAAGRNEVVVEQKHSPKENRNLRVEPENHLLGLFIVEVKDEQRLLTDIMETSLITVEESKALLQTVFLSGQGVSVHVVKISLLCQLSKEKLKVPVRGLFCSHFLCFDLENYVMMVARSSLPRWTCPLCPLPCYQFKIDCILLSILEQYRNHSITEAMFFKDDTFSVSTDQGYVEKKPSPLCDLAIKTSYKRVHPEKTPAASKKAPPSSQIVELD